MANVNDRSTDDEPAPGAAPQPWLEVVGSRYLLDWLDEQRISLAFSTYQTGKLFLVGRKPDRRLGVFERTFAHCMGLWASADARTLWMNSRYQLWRFDNMLPAGGQHNGFDAVYVPRVGYTTGHLDVHDIAVEASGRVVFVNTMFGCLATLSDRASFTPLWRPPFVSAIAPEDRCHLNGLALRDGRVRYVTACGRTDVPEGWRERRVVRLAPWKNAVRCNGGLAPCLAGSLAICASARTHFEFSASCDQITNTARAARSCRSISCGYASCGSNVASRQTSYPTDRSACST